MFLDEPVLSTHSQVGISHLALNVLQAYKQIWKRRKKKDGYIQKEIVVSQERMMLYVDSKWCIQEQWIVVTMIFTFYHQCYRIKEARNRATCTSSTPYTDMRCSEIVQQPGWVIVIDGSYGDIDDAASLVECWWRSEDKENETYGKSSRSRDQGKDR